MKALVCRELVTDIGQLRIEDWTLPPLKAGEARVRVRAAAANFVDILQVQGKHQHKPVPPFIPGLEGAGDVIAVGEGVTNVQVGDRVTVSGQAFAEEMQGPASSFRKIPGNVDYAIAASFRVGYLTAYVALVRRGRIMPREWLLVHGAAGGMGLAAVDLGKALGARVIATASTEVKRAFVKEYGADHVLPSSGFRLPVKEITGSGGADVIYDPVGGDVFDESTRCINFNGRLLIVGFTSGRIPTIPVNIPLVKGFSVVGVRAGEYGRKFPEKGLQNLDAIDALLAEGKIRPHISARLPFSKSVEALRMLEDRSVIGKVVVEM